MIGGIDPFECAHHHGVIYRSNVTAVKNPVNVLAIGVTIEPMVGARVRFGGSIFKSESL